MKKIHLLLGILSLFASCTEYETSEYIEEENKAINDLIFQLTNADSMIIWNNYGHEPILFIIDTLFVDYNRNEDFDYSTANKRLIAPLVNNRIKPRLISAPLNHDIISVKRLSSNRYNKLMINGYNTKSDNEFGLFTCSRIIFNKKFTEGFLIYSFLCGEACGWGGLISIEKNNNKWRKKEELDGRIF